MSTGRLLKLKEALEEGKTKRERAEGSLETLLKQLREEYGCKTAEEAEEKLKELRKKTQEAEAELEEALEELEEKHSELLEQA